MMIFHRVVLLLASLMLIAPASAEDYPNRPVKFIVPYAAGGAVDILARVVAQTVGPSLGQPVVVENRPGASTAVGATVVAQSEADGYTLLVATASTTSLNPFLFSKVSYQPSQFQPVALLGKQPLILVTAPQLPFTNLQELLTFARANPGKLNYATIGPGSVGHLMGEKFKVATGIDIVPIPYKGGAPAITDLLSNQVQLYFDGISSSVAQVQSGALKTFGVTSDQRVSITADVKTFKEQGYPAMTTYFWIGLLAPVNTPAPVVEKLNRVLREALAKPEVVGRLAQDGIEPGQLSVQEFGQMLTTDREEWRKIIAPMNLKLD